MHDTLDPNLARQFDRMAPHSQEAEECLIGSIISAGGDKYVAECRAIVTREMFYQADRQIIWDTVVRMADREIPINGVTLHEAMAAIKGGVLAQCGGAAYLGHLFNCVPAAAGAVSYARVVREKFIRRRAIEIGNDLLRLAYEPMEPAEVTDSLMRQSEELIRAATDATAGGAVKLEDALMAVLDRQDKKTPRRLNSGLFGLDDLIGGLGLGLTTVIAGQAGMGKSQLMKQLFINIARQDIPVGIITVEENREKIAENYLASASGVDNHKIAYDRLAPEDWKKLHRAAPDLAKLPIYIEDAAFSLTEIEIAARRLVSKYGCRAIAVDHIHLVSHESEKNRTNEVSKISSGLKRLYRKLGVAGVSLAQLNRSHQQGERPTLRSLRDSGTIEQDGDVILLLYREDYFKYAEPGYVHTNELEIIVAKNKYGGPGVTKAHFSGGTQSITDVKDVFAPTMPAGM